VDVRLRGAGGRARTASSAASSPPPRTPFGRTGASMSRLSTSAAERLPPVLARLSAALVAIQPPWRRSTTPSASPTA